MKAVLANLGFGLRLGLWIGGSAAAVECAAMILEGALSDERCLVVTLAALVAVFIHSLSGVALGIALGLIAAFVAGRGRAADLAGRGLENAASCVWTRDPERRRVFVIRVVASALWLGIAAAASVAAANEIVVRIETPLYAAILAVASTLGCLFASALAWPIWRRAGEILAAPFRRLPPPAIVLAILAVIVIAGAGILTAITWTSIGRYVPWRGPLAWIGLVGTLGLVFALARRIETAPRARRVLRLVFGIAAIAGLATAFILPRSLLRVSAVIADAEGPIAGGRIALWAILDPDRDGFLPIMGQGDCAPFDPAIHPGAVDVPGDGKDENCDGRDARFAPEASAGRHDYPASPSPVAMPVIFITLDAVSAGHLDLYGYHRPTMPLLHRHARSASVFEWAFSQGPSTRLSFPSMMTSRFDTQIPRTRSRRTTAPWGPGVTTLAGHLARVGFVTEAVAPDRYFSTKIDWVYKGFGRVDKTAASGPKRNKTAAAVTEATLARLAELDTGKPFFLWVHYTDAHGPHSLPRGVKPFPGGREVDVYDRELELLDEEVDDLLAGIEERFGQKPHIVALSADHGEAFDTAHGKFRHGHDLSTSVTRVPLVFWSPYSGGRRVDRIASTLDIGPTLLNMTGQRVRGLSGDSLLPQIQGEPDPGRPIMQQFFLHEYDARGKEPLVRVAVRWDRFVLHQNLANGEEGLFDYRADPEETKDLSASMPDVVSRLASYRDTFLSWSYAPSRRTR